MPGEAQGLFGILVMFWVVGVLLECVKFVLNPQTVPHTMGMLFCMHIVIF